MMRVDQLLLVEVGREYNKNNFKCQGNNHIELKVSYIISFLESKAENAARLTNRISGNLCKASARIIKNEHIKIKMEKRRVRHFSKYSWTRQKLQDLRFELKRLSTTVFFANFSFWMVSH